MKIRNLLEHPLLYVTPSELADYWKVSRKQIGQQIRAGRLKAARLGPRLLRVTTTDAIEFERCAKIIAPDNRARSHTAGAAKSSDRRNDLSKRHLKRR